MYVSDIDTLKIESFSHIFNNKNNIYTLNIEKIIHSLNFHVLFTFSSLFIILQLGLQVEDTLKGIKIHKKMRDWHNFTIYFCLPPFSYKVIYIEACIHNISILGNFIISNRLQSTRTETYKMKKNSKP